MFVELTTRSLKIIYIGSFLLLSFLVENCNHKIKTEEKRKNAFTSSLLNRDSIKMTTPSLYSLQDIDTTEFLNIKQFGVDANGINDDGPAINKAILALKKTDKKGIFFPKGTYTIKSRVLLTGDNIQLVGISPQATLLKGDGVKELLTNGKITGGLKIKNIGFDGAGVKKAIINLEGKDIKGSVFIENSIFKNPKLHIIYLNEIENVSITNNVFQGDTKGTGAGIYLINGCKDIVMDNNKFSYLYNTVYIVGKIAIGKGENRTSKNVLPNTDIVFSNNIVTSDWFLFPGDQKKSGSRVQYSKNTLIDFDANFEKFKRGDFYVRIYQPLFSNNLSSANKNLLKDSSAEFDKKEIQPGDLILVNERIALIKEVHKQELLIENWLNQKDLSDASPPTEGSNYKIVRILLGNIKKNNTNKIWVGQFCDLSGNPIAPEEEWEYTILTERPNYPFFASANNKGFKIYNNTFIHGWADQIAVYGDNASINHNLIVGGRDMGITLHGQGHVVRNNTIDHQGTGAIFLGCTNSQIIGNTVGTVWWRASSNDKTRGVIISKRPGENDIQNNDLNMKSKKKNLEEIENRVK